MKRLVRCGTWAHGCELKVEVLTPAGRSCDFQVTNDGKTFYVHIKRFSGARAGQRRLRVSSRLRYLERIARPYVVSVRYNEDLDDASMQSFVTQAAAFIRHASVGDETVIRDPQGDEIGGCRIVAPWEGSRVSVVIGLPTGFTDEAPRIRRLSTVSRNAVEIFLGRLELLGMAESCARGHRRQGNLAVGPLLREPTSKMPRNNLRIVDDDAGIALAQDAGRDAILEPDTENRPACAEILEDLARHVARLFRIVPLRQQQNIRVHPQVDRFAVGRAIMDGNTIRNAMALDHRGEDAPVGAVGGHDDVVSFFSAKGDRFEQRRRIAPLGIKNAGIDNAQDGWIGRSSRIIGRITRRIETVIDDRDRKAVSTLVIRAQGSETVTIPLTCFIHRSSHIRSIFLRQADRRIE